jgi:hypothetical protein
MIDLAIRKPAFRQSEVFAPDGQFQINRDKTFLAEGSVPWRLQRS